MDSGCSLEMASHAEVDGGIVEANLVACPVPRAARPCQLAPELHPRSILQDVFSRIPTKGPLWGR
jgi:hypothetical protein